MNLGVYNKTLLVLGACKDQSKWSVYDYRDSTVSTNAWRLDFTLSTTAPGDQATITYGSGYNTKSYTLLVFYRP